MHKTHIRRQAIRHLRGANRQEIHLRRRRLCGKRQPARPECLRQQLRQTRFKKPSLTTRKPLNPGRIRVDAHHLVPERRQASGMHRA